MKTMLLAACCAVTAAPAFAQTLEVRDVIGRIEVTTGGYDRIEVRVIEGPARDAPEVRRNGADVEIAGDWDRGEWFRGDGISCRGDDGELRVRMGRGDYVPISDLPLVQVTAPEGVTVDFSDSILFGSLGAIGGGEIRHSGCGDLTVESVRGDLRAAVAGSGEMAVGAVGGALTVNVAGSGAVQVGAIGGNVDGSIAGSGDVAMGRVGGDMDLDIAGSGAFTAEEARGDVDTSIAGSGDVHIGGGEAGEIRVSIMGSGNFSFDGSAQRARVNTAGSGDVMITQAADADVHVAGSGDVRVNGVRMR